MFIFFTTTVTKSLSLFSTLTSLANLNPKIPPPTSSPLCLLETYFPGVGGKKGKRAAWGPDGCIEERLDLRRCVVDRVSGRYSGCLETCRDWPVV